MGCRTIIVCAVVVALNASSFAAPPSGKSDAPSIAGLQKRIKLVQNDAQLAADVKEKVLGYLQGAVERLEIAKEQSEAAAKLEHKLAIAADTLQAAQQQLADVPPMPDESAVPTNDLDELARIVDSREKELDDAQNGLRKRVADLDMEAAETRTRPEELLNQLAEVEDRLREIDDEVDDLATANEPRELMQAHQMFLAARRQRAETERRMARAEADWLQSPLAAELLQVQQELAAKTLALKIAELAILEEELGKRRGDEADQRVRQAEAVVAKAIPALKPIASENLEIAKEQREVTSKLRDVEHRHETTTTTLTELQKEFDRTQKMVEDVGLTDTIGLMLRQQRSRLVDLRTLRSNLSRRNDRVRETRMRLFQLESERAALIDLEAAIAKRAEELNRASEQKSVPAELKTLLADQRQMRKGLEADYARYFKQLIEMDVLERRMLELSTKYAAYVDERVLWIRTGQLFGGEHLAKSTEALAWISDPKSWAAVGEAVWRDAVRRPVSWILLTVVLATWLITQPVCKGMIQRRGVIAEQIECRDLMPTLQSLMLTFILASGGPFLIGFVAWRLDHTSVALPFVHAVAAGLWRAAMFAIPLEILRIACLRGGLAERHFDWPQQLVDGWKRNLAWFLPAGILLVGAIGLIEGTTDEHRLDSIGRMTFLLFTASSGLFSLITIRRSRTRRDDMESDSEREGDVWSAQFWRFAPSLAVMVCAGLFVLALSGYFYTALQLTWRLQQTAWMAVGLLMVRAVIRRWIALERRRMAVLQDAELQSIADAGREPGNSDHNPFLFPKWHWPEFRLNLTQIVTQMRRLLDTGLMTVAVIGLWFTWADITPALNILDNVTLWHTHVEQTVTTQEGENGTTAKTILRPKRVTAADLGLGILVIAIAMIAGRNVPGLVEVILLEHLSVDAGVRFAATCLVRYAIFIAGVCGAFAQIGVGWSNVQWLVAAASVGLGFGLQEIFGNFVSGIILLFERPMRVGDVVTIGDTTGTISRIRFRATTIVDGDRKELIVPNKEFITGHLLNWTLSDRVNRVNIKVVASGHNDPERVRKLLLEIASTLPCLLKDPTPTATLEDVNGGLTFMLRGFLPSLDSRGAAIHDLYAAVNERFKAEGIELSCPTQEVIVRMDSSARSAIGAGPHQPPAGTAAKTGTTDFGTALRRA